MSISKILTLAALAAALVFIFGDVVENQERKIKGIVVQTPTGLNTTGRPVANARIEYMGDNSTEVQSTTTDSNGRFELPSGTSGIVTASKSGLTTISVGYIDGPNSTMPSSELRIELPRPATLSGRLYDMATRRNAGAGMVAVVVDHEVNPRSAADFVTNGQYNFDGLPPGSATLVAHGRPFRHRRSALLWRREPPDGAATACHPLRRGSMVGLTRSAATIGRLMCIDGRCGGGTGMDRHLQRYGYVTVCVMLAAIFLLTGYDKLVDVEDAVGMGMRLVQPDLGGRVTGHDQVGKMAVFYLTIGAVGRRRGSDNSGPRGPEGPNGPNAGVARVTVLPDVVVQDDGTVRAPFPVLGQEVRAEQHRLPEQSERVRRDQQPRDPNRRDDRRRSGSRFRRP